MTAVREVAPAKVNLFLHVGGLRPDRLHDLKSLIVFVGAGDVIEARRASKLSLSVDGPFADALAPFPVESNLVWRAAEALAAATRRPPHVELRLTKRLPVAAGVGGGSADAAAALRALMRLWNVALPASALNDLAFRLGADVPVCLAARPARVGGAGETVTTGPVLPPLWAALVNPGVPTPTGPVFRAFDAANPAPPAPTDPAPARLSSYEGVRRLFAESRNDLEPPARALAPKIDETLRLLNAAPCAVAARMSGSGATAFALFASKTAAERAANAARGRGWWAEAGKILG